MNTVIYVVKVTELKPISENSYRLALDEQPDPNAQKCLPRISHAHSWAKRVCEAKGARAYSVDAIVKEMIPLTCKFINAVDV
jgi:hypothetical protein